MKTNQLILRILNAVITFFMVRALLNLLWNDTTASLVPGWHTTIYPLPLLALMILGLLVIILLIIKLNQKLLYLIWKKLMPDDEK